MKPCVLNQLDVINHQCMIIVYISARCIVCWDCVLVSCRTYMMENAIETRYDVTLNSFGEWHFCTIWVYCNDFESNLSDRHWNKSPCCTVLKNMCVQFHHYHMQNFKQKLMFPTKFVSNHGIKYTEDSMSKLMQLFCDKDSPVDSQLYENMCLKIEYFRNFLTN